MFKKFSISLLMLFYSISIPLDLSGKIPQSSLEVMPPMNQIYHPVSTTNIEAQKSFDMGLTYIFAFNHDLAYREFEKAAKIDPNLAMAYWGMALALGQNVNSDVTRENEIKAYNLVQQALKLSSNSSPSERAYILALSKRYTNDGQADLIPFRFYYREAMKRVAQDYPQDLDASTLYAESLLNLNPWRWWTPYGKANEGTFEAMDVLESVLKRNPSHIGANHYYIHAVEESPFPERGLMSAHRLETLLPESGHLLHMPCHIFITTGDYKSAIKTNTKAIAADLDYINKYGMGGNYPLHYLSHNLYVLTRTYMLMGDYDKALQSALDLNKFIEPAIDSDPHLAHFAYVPFEVFLYFHKWKEILDYKPLAENSILVQAYQQLSKAIAFASLGDLESALNEREKLRESIDQIPPDEQIANNFAQQVFKIGELTLDAVLADAQNNRPQSIDYLSQAVKIQDSLNYDEPPGWFLLVRQPLGAALLKEKRYQEAEVVFQQALKKLRRNGRLLFGLFLSLKGQDRSIDAFWVEREMINAQSSAKDLKLDDL